MKRLLVIAALAAGVVTILIVSQMKGNKAAQSGNAEQEVRALVREWDEAFQRRDPAALNRILADDFVMTDASGAVLNKMQYLSSVVKAPDISHIPQPSPVSDDVTVRVYGDAAVVTGHSTVKGRSRGRGQFLSGQYRFTDVWVKRQGQWQAVATQGTSIAK
jgi:uncharacterized protein (TIGR02246 family)